MTTMNDALGLDASLDDIWCWLCTQLPGLAESPGLGIVGGYAGPLSYCEGRLTGLIARALGLDLNEVWFTEGLMALGFIGSNIRCSITVTAGYGSASVDGKGEAECEWGDTSRFPSKEARLRAVANLLEKMAPQLATEAAAKADEAARGVTWTGSPTRRLT